MKRLVGGFLIALGIILGLYVGVWFCFVGGIIGLVDVVNKLIDGNGLDGALIAWSIVKIMFAGLSGYLAAIIFILPSIKLFNIK